MVTGQFLQQLRSAVRYARIRRGWAVDRLKAAEKDVRDAQRDLKRWTRPDKRRRTRKRAKK